VVESNAQLSADAQLSGGGQHCKGAGRGEHVRLALLLPTSVALAGAILNDFAHASG
jgi:hypothetical protein